MVKIGDQIELIHTDDPYTNLKKGDRGIVKDIDEIHFINERQIWIKWDNGNFLALLDGRDLFRIV